jgi:GH24 family phage-related lysozyme (muramidase)
MTDWQPTKLRDFFLSFDDENPNHKKAADLLQKHAAQVMNDGAEWVKVFRGATGDTTYLDKAAEIIAEFEGYRGQPYKCPAGVWTIGYGTTYYPNGTLVNSSDASISKAKAEELLNYHIENAIVPILSRSIPTWGVMNGNQKAAIVSFAYNLGSHFYGGAGFNTITKALSKKENWSQVPAALRLYVNPGTTFEAGLRRRRQAEGELWAKAG